MIAVRPKRWSEEEIQFLKNNYSKLSFEELEESLGRSKYAIKERAYKYKLKKKMWTLEQINFLKANYKEMSIEDLEEKLGKTGNAIKLKASRLGIHKNNVYK